MVYTSSMCHGGGERPGGVRMGERSQDVADNLQGPYVEGLHCCSVHKKGQYQQQAVFIMK